MKKRIALAGLAALTLSMSAGTQVQNKAEPTPTVMPSPLTPTAHPTYLAPQQNGRFQLLTMIERDLDAIWTTEERVDGKYLIDLQLRFKGQYNVMPGAYSRTNDLGQILHLQRRGTTRSYMIVGNNGNYFGSVDELLQGTVTFDLYDGHVEPLRRRIRTFEFVPNDRGRK